MRNCKKAGIDTPTVYLIDTVNSSIYMEYIDGPSLRDYIMNAAGTMAAENGEGDFDRLMHSCTKIRPPFLPFLFLESELARQFGGVLAALHSIDLIHGDLTTSNVLVRKDSLCLVLIDFGLSQKSTLAEDKAVDLYVLERAFLSTHPGTEALVSRFDKQKSIWCYTINNTHPFFVYCSFRTYWWNMSGNTSNRHQ